MESMRSTFAAIAEIIVKMYSPSKVTLRDVLSKPSTLPATRVEVKAAHHLVALFIKEKDHHLPHLEESKYSLLMVRYIS